MISDMDFKVVDSQDPEFKRMPGKSAHDMYLDNVPGCVIYILIIGERFGTKYKGINPDLKGKSVTWAEVEVALFTLQLVMASSQVYRETPVCGQLRKQSSAARANWPTCVVPHVRRQNLIVMDHQAPIRACAGSRNKDRAGDSYPLGRWFNLSL